MPGTEQEWNDLANERYKERRVPRFIGDGDYVPVGANTWISQNVEKVWSEEIEDALVTDEVNHPDHYNNGKVEAIEAIEASESEEEFRGYLKGNALKYIWRYKYKGKPKQDLEKARWYLDKLIERL